MTKRQWISGALVLSGLVAAPAIVDRAQAAAAEKSAGQQTCGEKFAATAPIFDKSADVLSKGADVLTAHGQWVGNSAQAKPEKDALNKLASSYRESAQQMRKVSQELAAQKNLKDVPHDMKSPEAARVGQLMKEQAKSERELSAMLDRDARELDKAATEQMSGQGVGGSGSEQKRTSNEELKDQNDRPGVDSPDMIPPDQR